MADLSAEYGWGRYVSKPIEIEAIRWLADDNDEDVKQFSVSSAAFFWRRVEASDGPFSQVFDYLHDTWVGVYDGQWIIRGTKGELYPCDDEVFRAKYRPLERRADQSDGPARDA